MAISYQDIRTDRQWRSSTGLSEDQFLKIATLFGQAYEELFGESIEERQKTSPSSRTFQSYEALLFFGLYSIKSGLTYDLLALSFGLSPSNAYEMQSLSLSVLQEALALGGYLPNVNIQAKKRSKNIGNKRAISWSMPPSNGVNALVMSQIKRRIIVVKKSAYLKIYDPLYPIKTDQIPQLCLPGQQS